MTRVTIELEFDQHDVTRPDVINYIMELIDNDMLDYEVDNSLDLYCVIHHAPSWTVANPAIQVFQTPASSASDALDIFRRYMRDEKHGEDVKHLHVSKSDSCSEAIDKWISS